MNDTKAIVLLSGLDSIISAKILKDMGIYLFAIHFWSVFSSSSKKKANQDLSFFAERFGIPLYIEDFSCFLVEKVKNPKYGYGKNLNPCIDCKIEMFKKAKMFMKKMKAEFIVSGEVLGERPFSQRREVFDLIEKETGLSGLILRPLSAKLLKPTIPEERGWVERDKLFAIRGRSRRFQMEIAKQLGIYSYPTPAGGCLLTDPGFSKRVKDLLYYQPDFGVEDIELLKLGRHFRISPSAKLIVPRTDKEEEILKKYSHLIKFSSCCDNGRSRISFGVGQFSRDDTRIAVDIISYYLPKDIESYKIQVVFPDGKSEILEAKFLSSEKISFYRIN